MWWKFVQILPSKSIQSLLKALLKPLKEPSKPPGLYVAFLGLVYIALQRKHLAKDVVKQLANNGAAPRKL